MRQSSAEPLGERSVGVTLAAWVPALFSFVVLLTMLIGGSAASAATHAALSSGIIHVYAVGSASSATQDVVVTGAFADAGTLTVTGGVSTLQLSRGSIVVNLAQGAAAENRLFNHLAKHVSATTCGMNTSYLAQAKLVSGTGAYTGISGTIQLRTAEIGVFPRTASGTCDLSSSAQPIGFLSLAQGSGRAQFPGS
jgi:hypothetical protein